MMYKDYPKIIQSQANNPNFIHINANSVATMDCGELDICVSKLGNMVREARLAKGLTQGGLAAKVGVDPQSISNLETGRTKSLKLGKLSKLAEALGLDVREVMPAVEEPSNIQPYGEEAVPDIPEFDMSIAAGEWAEVAGIGEVCDPAQVSRGVFRVRIHGDSMEREYADGSLVEFRCLRDGRDVLELGKDYYIQRRDGYATFKRLIAIDGESLRFLAINRKYKEPLYVHRDDVVRMARAIYQLKAM